MRFAEPTPPVPMRKNRTKKSNKGDYRLRETITHEAARIMYQEDVAQYHTAKWRAAKSILSRGGKNIKTIRTRDLPSNGEISSAIYQMATFYEGDTINYRLFTMRLAALDIMEELQVFSPRLIGSVSTGRIKKNSDIDVHIFTDSLESLKTHLDDKQWPFECKQVCIMHNGKPREFTHIYLEHEFSVELSVYPENEIRVRTRSSTDGKPIIRLSYDRLLALIEREHGEAWEQYLAGGER